MITAGPPVGSADSASAAERVVPSADVSSRISADAPPAMRGRTRSAGRSGGWASKAKHTAALLAVVWSGAPRILRRPGGRAAARAAPPAGALALPAFAPPPAAVVAPRQQVTGRGQPREREHDEHA